MYLARDKHFGQKQLETWTCGWRILIKEMSAHTDILADVIAGALTAENLSYYSATVLRITRITLVLVKPNSKLIPAISLVLDRAIPHQTGARRRLRPIARR